MAEGDDFRLDIPSGISESTLSRPPLRKRRRPALSCEQCRRRKIRCDRNYPCNHCSASKTAVCSYSSDNVVAHALQEQSHPKYGLTIPERKKQPSSIASTHHSSDASSPRPATFSARTTEHNSPSTDTGRREDNAASRKQLLKRIRELEERLAGRDRSDVEERLSSDDASPRRMQSLCDTLHAAQNFRYEDKSSGFRGTVSKTRFFGQSHWMYSYGTFDKIACMNVSQHTNTPDFDDIIKDTGVPELMLKCKSLARGAKAKPHKQWLLNPDFRESVPERKMADKLVYLYFRTSESIHRILHIPSFQQEYLQYWDDPAGASTVFVVKLLLVMAVGACFYQGSDSDFWHSQALQWIFAAQSWLASPFEKGKLHMSGVQIHCLLLIARLDNAVAGDLIWISAGALLRVAFQMGYHRDPKHLPQMPQWHAEMRRRLWATIIELNTQSALDSGMPPLFSFDDFDTEAPANIDDIDLDENTIERATSRSSDVFTQTSLQLMLLSSLQSRLEIIRHANSVRYNPSYDEALALGNELTKICKTNNLFITRINSVTPHLPRISQLQRNLLDLNTRRFLLSVHRPFAVKAQNSEPRYYFSRKVVLDCAMTVLSYPSTDPKATLPIDAMEAGYRDDYTWLKTMSGGFQKGFIVHAAMVIFAELLTMIEEDTGMNDQGSLAREPLKQALRDIIELASERIRTLENNVKGHLFISIVLAQVEAMEQGWSEKEVEQAVLKAAEESLKHCLGLLEHRIKKGLTEDEYTKITNATSPTADLGAVLAETPETTRGEGGEFNAQEFGMDFSMADWNMDMRFPSPDSWLLSGWEDNRQYAF